MKITLFSDYRSFQESLDESQESMEVLDFTGDSRLKKDSSLQTMAPMTLSGSERTELVEEYVETISTLGHLNRFSLSWLCHPISEKNELIPGHLFEVIWNYIVFKRTAKEFQGDRLYILGGSDALAGSIVDYCKQEGIEFRLVGNWWLAKTPITKFRRLLGSLRNQWKLLSRKRCRARQYSYLSDSFDGNKTYTVLRSWFDQRSWDLIGRDKDVYYGKLPEFLKQNSRDILFYGDVTNSQFGPGEDETSPSLEKLPPVLLEGRFLKLSDFFRGMVFRLFCSTRINFSEEILISGNDVRVVFSNYFQTQLNNLPMMSNYFTYLAARRLVKQVKMIQFINLFEHYSWEKVTTLAIRESGKSIITSSFQHAQVAASSVKFFMGEEEAENAPLPDKIITLGDVTRKFLVEKCNYPAHRTVTGCALRHDYQIPDQELPMQRKKRLQVYLWTFERSLEMLEFLHAHKNVLKDYEISIGTHPIYPIEKLKPHLSFEDISFFKLSCGRLVEDFVATDVVMYSGTTVSLDALANGLPVINVEFDDFLSPDPLMDFEDFKWTVRTGEELERALKAIETLSDDDYYQRQKKALAYVRNYFYPVNEKNLEVFL